MLASDLYGESLSQRRARFARYALSDLGPLAAELQSVRVSLDEFVLSGSMVMALHGIMVRPGDVDMFVTKDLYGRLLSRKGWEELRPREGHPPMLEWSWFASHRGPRELKLNAWYEWDDDHLGHETGVEVVEEAFASRELVNGWPCISLATLRRWKYMVAPVQAKHFDHVELIDRHEGRSPTLSQAIYMQGEVTWGFSDYDLLRGLYFMLANSLDLQHDTCLSWEWWEGQMRRLQSKGLVWKRPWGERQNVWDLTTVGADLVTRGLELE